MSNGADGAGVVCYDVGKKQHGGENMGAKNLTPKM